MPIKNKAKITSVYRGKTLPISASPSHVDNKLLIDFDKLSVRLGDEQALNNVSFCIHRGEFIGLIGPNGAGKTTLLRAILGLLTPDKGKISKLSNLSVGYIPQGGAGYDKQVPMSVLEIVKLGSRGNTHKAREALESVKMLEFTRRRFNQLSGGQRQRVLIAKTLAASPDLLILDEPTTGIDERAQSEFYEILASLRQRGITVIMVSHDIDTVLKLVTRVMCLNQTILYDGLPQHFEADKYLPDFYTRQHVLLHHKHKVPNA